MNENQAVIKKMEKEREKGKQVALATVVRVTGSAYRREGAKMLIDEQGHTDGMISGGCLETNVAEDAKQVMASGQPAIKSYDMDENTVWGLGLGCPGTVDVFIESVSKGEETS